MLAERDPITGALMTVDYAHHEIHEGDAFMYSDPITLGAASQDYMLTTPDTTKFIHLLFRVQHLKDVQIFLYEASDKTGTTAQTNKFNQNRNSSGATALTIHKGTSGGTTDGTLIWGYIGGLAAGANVIGGIAGRDQEIMLKQNTKYILRITSGTASNTITTMLNWYEHKTIA